MSNRKYNHNPNFFDTIDTEQKAYILGLLYADGCNLSYRLTLEMIDEQIVTDVARAMGCNNPIKILRSKISTRSDRYVFHVFSRHLCEELSKKGCISRKTMSLSFPDTDIVPENLIHHFIRGYFDGDGSIYKYIVRQKYEYKGISIVGNHDFLQGLEKSLPSNIKSKIWKQSNKIPDLKINATNSVKIFRDWIYDGASIFLARKKNRFYE